MSPELFVQFIALLATVGVGAFTVIKVAHLFANRPRSLPDDLLGRVEELEQTLQNVQQQLAETQERLDFTERLLSTTREEHRLGR